MIRFLLLTACLAGTLSPAQATTLSEPDDFSFDFSDDVFNPTQFFLEPGLNTVSGILEGSDLDVFEFVFDPGHTVTSQLLVVAGFNPEVSMQRFIASSCEFGVGVSCTGTDVVFDTALPFDFAPIQEGIRFSADSETSNCAGNCWYTAEVFLSPGPTDEVPEPTTWTLLATGLGGVMWRRKRAARRG